MTKSKVAGERAVPLPAAVESLQQLDEFIPESVCHVDALLSRQVSQSQSVNELDLWLRIAGDVKRRISSVTPSAVDTEAQAELARLEREVTARSA
jgi:hypothetical protein